MAAIASVREQRYLEDQIVAETDPADIEAHNAEMAEHLGKIGTLPADSRFVDVLPCLPTMRGGELANILEPDWWGYYCAPWYNFFWKIQDPFEDLITIYYGPRGGGKTISATTQKVVDGMMRGIPVMSNVPISLAVRNMKNDWYKLESIPFDVERFAKGDMRLKYTNLLIDEGNYLTDRLRSTSNKNLALTDILQQARKFRMSVAFCSINWNWLDPRVTGSLLDVRIACKDLYYTNFGQTHAMRKGWRIAWDGVDQSGKLTGHEFNPLPPFVLDARAMWGVFDTENFVDPREARKKLDKEQKVMLDQFGQEVTPAQWFSDLDANIRKLAATQSEWLSNDMWNALGLETIGLRIKAGHYLKGKMGVMKTLDGTGNSVYDLSVVG